MWNKVKKLTVSLNSSCFPEYIVTFKGYYRQEARERFIEAALNESNVVRWAVLPRDNPASDYPSDFDVIQV